MRRTAWWAVLLIATCIATDLALRAGAPPEPAPAARPASHPPGLSSIKRNRGIVVTARLDANGSTLYAEVKILNLRDVPVRLTADRCGRATIATLVVPAGVSGHDIAWISGVAKLPFRPRSRCTTAVAELAPGAARTERWTLRGAAGQKNGTVHIDLVKANRRLRILRPVRLLSAFPPRRVI